MSTFLKRLELAFSRENFRRKSLDEKRLTKTDIWKAAGTTSAAASHWFSGSNGMDLSTCIKVAPLLRVNHFWLYDESKGIDEGVLSKPSPLRGSTKLSPAHAALAELAAALDASPPDADTNKLLAQELKLKLHWLRAVK